MSGSKNTLREQARTGMLFKEGTDEFVAERDFECVMEQLQLSAMDIILRIAKREHETSESGFEIAKDEIKKWL